MGGRGGGVFIIVCWGGGGGGDPSQKKQPFSQFISAALYKGDIAFSKHIASEGLIQKIFIKNFSSDLCKGIVR